ncbi:hypothetical protein Bbelb_446100 [Branchiostoma belcheri]|nr:hypothetical protein Bbelb_446100 [Branchiostoma belcheri]
MSGIELKPVEGGSPILLPLGETIVGRGPFFGDKRVSRSHGILDVSSGQLRLKPIHVNPCFFKSVDGDSLQPLPKDQWKDLQHGDQFALLPNTFVFEVIISDTFRKTTAASDVGTYADESVKVEEEVTSPAKQDEDIKSTTKDLPMRCPLKEEKKPEDVGDDDIKNTENLSTTNGAAESQEERKKLPSPAMSQETPSQKAKTTQVGNREVALPLERKRKLPEWMDGEAATCQRHWS